MRSKLLLLVPALLGCGILACSEAPPADTTTDPVASVPDTAAPEAAAESQVAVTALPQVVYYMLSDA